MDLLARIASLENRVGNLFYRLAALEIRIAALEQQQQRWGATQS